MLTSAFLVVYNEYKRVYVYIRLHIFNKLTRVGRFSAEQLDSGLPTDLHKSVVCLISQNWLDCLLHSREEFKNLKTDTQKLKKLRPLFFKTAEKYICETVSYLVLLEKGNKNPNFGA